MLHGEHSAILSTFIVIKILVLSILEWPPKTGFTELLNININKYLDKLEQLSVDLNKVAPSLPVIPLPKIGTAWVTFSRLFLKPEF